MCITADSAAVNTGRIIQEIKGHSRPVTRRVHGLEGREEGDCDLIAASPWCRRSTGSWPSATDDAAPPPPAGTDNNSLNCQSL